MLVQEPRPQVKKKEYLRCPYCRHPVLGSFTLEDHFFSNYLCGQRAKQEKRVPADFQVSLLVPV